MSSSANLIDSTFDYIANTLKSLKAAADTVVGILDHLDTLKKTPTQDAGVQGDRLKGRQVRRQNPPPFR